ncbi:YggT family protein [bacterium]|nr:YggT family protein [bacterium]
MEQIIKETVISDDATTQVVIDNPKKIEASSYQTAEYIIYYVFGVLEVLLAFRLILKLTGASMGSAFVKLIYALTGIFTFPFQGMFRNGFAPGVETTSVFEPSTFVAIIVYVVIAFGLVKLVRVLSKEKLSS